MIVPRSIRHVRTFERHEPLAGLPSHIPSGGWRMKVICSALLVALTATPSTAEGQFIEPGGSLGTGARGTESQMVRQEARLTGGLHLSAWWADRVEGGVRLVWVDLPSHRYQTGYGFDCATGKCQTIVETATQTYGGRRMVSGHGVYHFRRGRLLRPYLGVGVGTIHERERVECVTPGCEAFGLRPGERRYSYGNVAAISGLSTTLGDRLYVRGGIVFHRPAGEELSLFETSAQIGYRFRLW